MTDIQPPPSDDSAPRPWLSAATPAGTARGGQAWSPAPDTLVVSYPFVKSDYLRHLRSHLRRKIRWAIPSIAGIGFLLGSLPSVVLFMMHLTYPGSPLRTGAAWQSALLFWVGATVAMPVLVFVISQFLSLLITQLTALTAKNRQFTITLSAEGAIQEFELSYTLRWSEVRAIEPWEGGILLVAPIYKPPIGVPGSAFTDADAATRFSEAAHLLWKSNGDMNSVPEGVRTEFAPTPNAAPAP